MKKTTQKKTKGRGFQIIAVIYLFVMVGLFSNPMLAQNNALDFDGVDDYVNIPSISTNGFTGLTIEAWVYPLTFNPQAGDDYISNIAGHLDASSLLRIGDNDPAELQENNIAQFNVQTAGGIKKCSGTTALQANRWYHLAGTYDGVNMKLYVNGILEKTVAQNGGVSSTETSMDIAGSTTARFLEGMVDELRIWNDARTEAEIRQHMYRELPNPSGETNLVAYYKFNETSGTSLADSKGSFTGTLTNMSGNEWQTSPAMFGPKNALAYSGGEVSVNSTFGLGAVSVSGECWVNLPTANENGTFFNVGGHDDGYGIGVGNGTVETSGNNLIVIYDLQRWIDSEIPIGTGWHHVAFTIDADGRCTMYLDGISVYAETGDPADPNVPVGQTGIGTDVSTISRTLSNGTLDEVRIWNAVRTETEFRENMMKNLTGNESGLVAYYNFDNIVYSSTSELYMLADYSGNSYNAFTGSMTDLNLVASTAYNTWLNTTSTDWSTGSNWSLGSAPNSSSVNVGIPDHLTAYDPVISSAIQMNNLVVGSGASLSFNHSGPHTIHGNVFNIGTTNLEANTDLTITGSLYVLGWSTVNIKPLAALTVDKNLDLDFLLGSGNLNIKSNATGSGSLIVKGTATGSVNTERYIEAATWGTWDDGWHFVSSPVADLDIATSNFVVATAADYDFYAWSEPDNKWINFKTGDSPSFVEVNGSDDFELGHGYLVAYKNTDTKLFTGNINVEDVTVSGITNTGGATNYHSWHLLGNPFNSALTWDATWTKTNIGGSIQIWNEAGRSYTPIAADPGGVIPATNGFMIQGLDASTGSVTIPESKRVHNLEAFYKSAGFPIIKLKAINLDNPSFQESQLLFNPESSISYEAEYDCSFLPGYAPLFYSEIDDMPMALNSMPNLEETTAIPFTFIKNEGLNFSIEMYEHQNLELDVWLLDKELNKNQNLSENPVYTFTAFEQDNPDRFIVHFSPVGLPETETTTNPIQVYSNGKGINVVNNNNLTGEITILNILGQQMDSFKLKSNTNQSCHADFPSGVYVVYVKTSAGQVYSEKVIVN